MSPERKPLPAEMLLVNPRARTNPKRKHHHKRKRHHRRAVSSLFGNPVRRNPRRNPIRMRRNPIVRRFRRNPEHERMSAKEVSSYFAPALTGAVAALALDWFFGNIPLPATLTSGMMQPVTRLVAAFGIGAIAGAIGGKKLGEEVGLGALTVTGYSIIRNFVQTNVPSVALARFVPPGQRLRGLGYVNPARIAARPGTVRVMPPVIKGGLVNPAMAGMGRIQRR